MSLQLMKTRHKPLEEKRSVMGYVILTIQLIVAGIAGALIYLIGALILRYAWKMIIPVGTGGFLLSLAEVVLEGLVAVPGGLVCGSIAGINCKREHIMDFGIISGMLMFVLSSLLLLIAAMVFNLNALANVYFYVGLCLMFMLGIIASVAGVSFSSRITVK